MQKQSLLNVPVLHSIESFIDIEKKSRYIQYQNSVKRLEAKLSELDNINIWLLQEIQALMNKAL
jgi:hypothetical protein